MREKKYQASYGLLRIIACFSVVFHHFISANQQYINTLESQGMYTAVDNLLMCNNLHWNITKAESDVFIKIRR